MKNKVNISMLLKTSLFLIIPLTSCKTIAQETIVVKGVVTNSETGKPIENVSIYPKSAQNFTLTNKKGEYTIEITKGEKVAFGRHYYYGDFYDVDSSVYNVKLKPMPKEIQQAKDKKARDKN